MGNVLCIFNLNLLKVHTLKNRNEQCADVRLRREKIVEMVREDGTVSVKSLTQSFNLTEATIRSDLRFLQHKGIVQRYHGGATLMSGRRNSSILQLERKTNPGMKDAIGKLAANHIENGDTVIFDSGSTTTAIVNHLKHIQRLSVITPAVNIALKLGGVPLIDILLTGGTFKFPTISTSGEKAASFFDNVLAEKLFLATACISPRFGLSYPSETDINLKLAMINSARIVYVVADSSKIDKVSMFALPCEWYNIRYLITDENITQEQVAAFTEVGVEVLIARSRDVDQIHQE